MKTITRLILILLTTGLAAAAADEIDPAQRWRFRFDMGGNIPNNPTLSEIGGPVTTGGDLELSAGMSMDFGAGYRLTPWLLLEGSLGFTFNEVDSVGNWSYPDSSLSQLSMMLNIEFAPRFGRVVPFVGIGGGGVYSSISFGNYYYYYYSDSDGWGDDFVPAAQAFAGLRIEISPEWSVGVSYRFLATPSQSWDVEWWNGAEFQLGVDRVTSHSICISLTGSF